MHSHPLLTQTNPPPLSHTFSSSLARFLLRKSCTQSLKQRSTRLLYSFRLVVLCWKEFWRWSAHKHEDNRVHVSSSPSAHRCVHRLCARQLLTATPPALAPAPCCCCCCAGTAPVPHLHVLQLPEEGLPVLLRQVCSSRQQQQQPNSACGEPACSAADAQAAVCRCHSGSGPDSAPAMASTGKFIAPAAARSAGC